MRRLPIVAASLAIALIALAVLPSYAQPVPSSATSAYLAIVFRAAESPTAPATVPVPAASSTSTVTVSPSVALPANTPTVLAPSPSATTSSSAFPPVGPGTPTRTPTSKPIFTNGQDLWNCGDFGTWADSNVVYQANKPGDPNKLDQDDDSIPCETLPGAP